MLLPYSAASSPGSSHCFFFLPWPDVRGEARFAPVPYYHCPCRSIATDQVILASVCWAGREGKGQEGTFDLIDCEQS